ncbi:beta strand repeat-containing protein [Mucisphaera sp.]|uniref:beta strand repeat-containing protein n=1 Tax=Mucisphaera sp. TaxID=2913024 RepID=UPI003D0DCCB7
MPRSRAFTTGSLLAATLCLTSPQVQAQVAYFSLTGEITTVAGSQFIELELTDPATTANTLRIETWGSAGGTNAAGDLILPSNVDSVLTLSETTQSLNVVNDDGAPGPTRALDSLISWPGFADTGDTLPTSGLNATPGYELNLRDFSNNDTGTWAIDIVADANILRVTDFFSNPIGTGISQLEDFKIGTDSLGPFTAQFVYDNPSSTRTINGDLVVAQTGSGRVLILDGAMRVNGQTLIRSNGDIQIDDGVFTATDVTVESGGLLRLLDGELRFRDLFVSGLVEWLRGSLDLDPTSGITLASGGHLDSRIPVGILPDQRILGLTGSTAGFVDNLAIEGEVDFRGTATVDFATGVELSVEDEGLFRQEALFEPEGTTIRVDGTRFTPNVQLPGGTRFFGSSLEVIGGTVDLENATMQLGTYFAQTDNVLIDGELSRLTRAELTMGANGGTALVTITNKAEASFTNININDNSAAETNQIKLEVLAGAFVSADNIYLSNGLSNSTGEILVSGIDTELQQSGSSELIVGSTGTTGAQLNIDDNARFVTGSAGIIVQKGGQININNLADFRAEGDINIDGGQVNIDASGFLDVAMGRKTTIQNQGSLTSAGSYTINGMNTIEVLSGGTLSIDGLFDVGDSSDGFLIVDGAGSSVKTHLTNNGAMAVGTGGSLGDIVVRNGATADFQASSIDLATFVVLFGVTPGGNLVVESGGSVTANGLNVGTDIAGSALVEVINPGSEFTQRGNAALRVGGASAVDATVRVADGAVFNTGTGDVDIRQSGRLEIQAGATFNANGTLTIEQGGILTGDALIDASNSLPVFNDGTIIANSSNTPQGIHDLTIIGDYTQTIDGVLDIGKIPNINSLDRLVILNATSIQLDGELGLIPDPGDDFLFLTTYAPEVIVDGSTPITGTFDRILNIDLGDGTALAVTYDVDDVLVTRALIGDANLDMNVDLIDLSLLASNFNDPDKTWSQGDFNGDGLIDLIDLSLLASNFGASAIPIPEPTLALALAAPFITRRRTRQTP